jgi:OmpA-OmpF porin, OOP family
MSRPLLGFLATALALLLCPGIASASPASAQGWLRRHRPEPGSGELAIHAGTLLLNERHSLFHADPQRYLLGYKRLRGPNLALGFRGGYYPLRQLGIEAEAGLTPARLRDEPGSALVYGVRGQLVAQLGLWSITPFLLIGGGVLAIASKPAVLGRDVDPALHFGGGLKFAINRWAGVRVDARDIVTDKQGVTGPLAAHNLELLVGLTFTIRPPQ